MKVHVLDANALYRFLTGGPGADIVSRLLRDARDAEQPLRMSVVNWGEVYYTIARVKGFAETSKIMERVRLLPIDVLAADESMVTRAARLKAGHGLLRCGRFAGRRYLGYVRRERFSEGPGSADSRAAGA
jgi:predicted nucleic acid-binding protein